MSGRLITYRTPFFLPLIYPSLTWRIPAVTKKIFLTFDDGPVPGPTEFVLDVLKKASAKATFFCIGDNIRKHPEVFNAVLQEGHTIGNHTFNHLNGWKTNNQEYFDNMFRCEAEIKKHTELLGTSVSTSLFRPPYGKITWRQIRSLRDYSIIMWDVLSMDFDRTISPATSLKRTLQATRDGSIIVFHDSIKAEKNMSFILPRLIEHFSERGYSFESII